MSGEADPRQEFLSKVAAALASGAFAGLTLGKARGGGDLRTGSASLVLIKKQSRVRLLLRHTRRDEVKNFDFDEFPSALAALIGDAFHSAMLQTTNEDVTIDYNRKGEPRLTIRRARRAAAEPQQHDRAKAYSVSPDRPYLAALGVSDHEGRVKPTMQGKYRQINRFIEIVDGLIADPSIESSAPLTIVDIGSGKGYLTFALYDYLTNVRAMACRVTGIEVRADMVELCTRLASELGFTALSFTNAEARHAEASADVVIALHACDTATDDAMLIGLGAGARLIVTAPCCQHEIAPQLSSAHGELEGLLKYPLLRQRQADLLTDAARALLLEASGYKVKIIEFVSTEHTAKNILIAASRSADVDRERALRQYRDLKSIAKFSAQKLASGLGLDGE